MALLKVATCQFPVGADIDVNLAYVKRQMIQAAGHGARVAHFPEGALSGYAGVDFESFAGCRWDKLRGALGEVARHAARLGILGRRGLGPSLERHAQAAQQCLRHR